jgi:hypothetical protein
MATLCRICGIYNGHVFCDKNIVEAVPLDFLNQILEGRVEFRTENHSSIKIEYFVDINYRIAGLDPHNIFS